MIEGGKTMVEKKMIRIVLIAVFGVALCVIAAKKILPRVSRNTESAALHPAYIR